MMARPLRVSMEREIAAAPGVLWIAVADTDRLNRALGLPAVSYGPPSPEGLTRRASARWLGLRLEWTEHPFEWTVNEGYSVVRVFSRGPMRRYMGRVSLRPSGAGTRLDVSCEVLPVSWLEGLFLRWWAPRSVKAVIRYCEMFARGVAPGEHAPASIETGLLDALVDRARRQGAGPAVLDRLLRLLREGGDGDVLRMRPYALARTWGTDRRATLEAFLAAARAGLLRTSWQLRCPHCRVAKAEHHALSQVQQRFYCDVCDREYTASPARNIELVFSPCPAVRRPRAEVYCLGGPGNAPHVLVQRRVAAGAEVDLPLPSAAEPLRLRALGLNHAAELCRGEEADGAISLSTEGWSRDRAAAASGALRVANTLPVEAVVVVERVAWDADGVTVAEAGSVPALRRHLETETVAAGGTEGTMRMPPPEVLFAETAPAAPPAPEEPARLLGRYRILGEIARGGMGIVYRAFDPQLSRTVALKVTLFEESWASPEFIERFLREARSAAKLHHPNIVPVYDVGEAEGKHYFTMELVEGESLAERLSREGRMSPSSATEMVAVLARAVQHAHDRGLMHRDLKPSNVLIARDGTYLLTDFGLAKEIGGREDVTRSGDIVGTPAYMSPEQASGSRDEVDERTDVWALGAILFESLTGVPPFGMGADLLRKIQEEDPPRPRAIRREVPEDLETIALKALEKAKASRYPSAREIAAELDRFLRGEPIVARPVGTAARLWRKAKRHRAAAVPIAALAVALLATGGAWVGSALRDAVRFRRHLAEGEARLAAGDPVGAEDEAKKAAAIDAEDPRPKGLFARTIAARGRCFFAKYVEQRDLTRRLEEESASEEGGSSEERWKREEALLDARHLREVAWSTTVLCMERALEQDPLLKEARDTLAELYWDPYLRAERARDLAEMDRFVPLLLAHGGVGMQERLRGAEPVRIRFLLPEGFDPPEMEAWIYRYLRAQAPPVLVPVPCDPATGVPGRPAVADWRPVALTASSADVERARRGSPFSWEKRAVNRVALPVRDRSAILNARLPRGSYLLSIPGEQGLVECRHPFEVERGRPVEETCELASAGDVPPAPSGAARDYWVPVLAGLARLGGDPEALRVSGRRESIGRVPTEGTRGSFVGRFEVSIGLYLEYLNDREHHEARKALARVPRENADPSAGTVYVDWSNGTFAAVPGGCGADWAVAGISRADAEDFCAWLTRKAGGGAWRFRLPTEDEWERAARGADGRCFPWGDAFDPSFCCMKDSRLSERGHADGEPIGLFPLDESPWGVRDMAGGVREWTASSVGTDVVGATIKGGFWGAVAVSCRSALRTRKDPRDPHPDVGFRIVAERVR